MTAFTTFGTQRLLRTTVDLWVIVSFREGLRYNENGEL